MAKGCRLLLNVLLGFVATLCPAFVVTQEDGRAPRPSWKRVYTFADSKLEIDTAHVTFGEKNSGRVRTRWTLNKPESLDDEPEIKYKSRVDVFEFDCKGRRYRLSEMTLFGVGGQVIKRAEVNPPERWKAVPPGGVTERLYGPSCQLIEQRRRSP